ncbi:MAG: hypothetical protein EXS13_09130 [Planctomycetes bacterium]|nr:hypothetical protein [Planctomycetota bacterium]
MNAAPPRATKSPRRSRALPRAALVLFSVLATVAAAEVALRLLFRGDIERVLATRRREVAPDAQGILCVGDSYTFGLYYRPEESYPGRLEQILNAGTPAGADGRARWFVENSGIPAQNSAQMAARLPEQLARLQPKAVVVIAGFNDRWNFAEPNAESSDRSAISRWLDELVVVKFTRLLLSSTASDAKKLDGKTRLEQFNVGRIEVAGEDGGVGIDIKKVGRRLVDDAHYIAVAQRLHEMVAVIRAAGALPILCSYPSPEPHYEPPSRAAADVAKETRVPFVDLRAVFARELETHAYAELLIPGDRHPTDRGHWRMAAEIARALAAAGVWQPESTLRDELPAVAARGYKLTGLQEQLYPVTLAPATPTIPAAPIGAASTFALTGPPDAHWKILVAASDSPPQQFGSIELRLAADPLFAKSARDDRCEGTFDANGRAAWSVPPDLSAANFVALAVMHDLLVDATDLQVRGLAGPLPLH